MSDKTHLVSPVSPLEETPDRSLDSILRSSIDVEKAKRENARRDRIAADAPQAWVHNDGAYAPEVINKDSEIQVWHGKPGEAPQVTEVASPLYSVGPEIRTPTEKGDDEKNFSSTATNSGRFIRRICGLRKRTFWIMFAVSILIMLAVVGGGIGGAVAKQNHQNAQKAVATSSAASTPTTPVSVSSSSSSSSSTSKTSSASATPSTKPTPQFSLQTWEYSNLTGRTQMFYTKGYFRTSFKARAYTWHPGTYTEDIMDVCSMAFCQGDVEIGWWGSSDHTGVQPKWNGTEYGDSTNIQCASVFGDPGCLAPFDTASIQTVPIIDAASETTSSTFSQETGSSTTFATTTTKASTSATTIPKSSVSSGAVTKKIVSSTTTKTSVTGASSTSTA